MIIREEYRSVLFVFLALAAFITSIIAGMDAWQYWWIKTGLSSYSIKEMKVSSVKYSRGPKRSEWVDFVGVIEGQSVHGQVKINRTTRENNYLKFIDPGELVEFYCQVPIKKNKIVRLIEASFIRTPHSKIWWVPLLNLAAVIFFVLFLRDKHGPLSSSE